VANRRNLRRNSAAVSPTGRQPKKRADLYDVVIVGAGPAGSTLGWKLASQGLKTLVLDGARFPREKVCGDYIEPRGLRVLNEMGCLQTLEATSPLPIVYSSTYVDSERCYIGRIPFYGVHKHLPPHGYIVPRDVLDNVILETAVKGGATVQQETYVTGFSANRA
jgi:flavin-dependent dehydrogenase